MDKNELKYEAKEMPYEINCISCRECGDPAKVSYRYDLKEPFKIDVHGEIFDITEKTVWYCQDCADNLGFAYKKNTLGPLRVIK